MMTKLSLIGAALAMTAGGIAAPASAQYYGGDRYYSNDRGYYGGGDRYDRGDRYGRGDRYYARGDRFDRGDRAGWYRDRGVYRGRDYRYDCRRGGTTGTVLGAVVGGLLGREAIGRRGDRTAGLIAGAGVGALAGRAIDRGDNRCR